MVHAQHHGMLYECGRWKVDFNRRELSASGIPIPIGLRTFEILEILVRSAGTFVSKDDLMRRVWPGARVEENTLEVHISAIRKALGDDRGTLKTASRRGYCLVGNWMIRNESGSTDAVDTLLTPSPEQHFRSNLPLAHSELIGREQATGYVGDLLSAYRAVTLTGPGGIGKTSLALEVARRLFSCFEGDGWLVELAGLSDPNLVASAVAEATDLRLTEAEISPTSVAQVLGRRNFLLVLDNCEHVIDAAAELVAAVLDRCPHASVLATSREPLQIDGEYTYRVPPLDVPAANEPDASNILEHSAVRLFIAKVQAASYGFSPGPANLPTIGRICRHLDGIPLAIEFAASRAATLGLDQIVSYLNDRLSLLTKGRRTALPRHQTLRATLDWSYDLLPAPEQRVLDALAVFSGGFTMEAAVNVINKADETALDVVQCLENLVEKSLVVKYKAGEVNRWRLLETVREYALEKLSKSGNAATVARQHAVYFRGFVSLSSTSELTSTTVEASEDVYIREIDNVRSALEWTFSEDGDAITGITLTAAFARIWLLESLMFECQHQVGRALDALDRVRPINPDMAYHEMMLLFARGEALIHTSGCGPETIACWTKALEVGEQLGDVECSLRALWRLWSIVINVINFREVFTLLEQFEALAKRRTEPTDTWILERMMGVSLHFFGDQLRARRHLEHLLSTYDSRVHRPDIVRLPFDKKITAHVRLAAVLWLLGYPDQAMRAVEDNVAEAVALGHVSTLATMLAQNACRVALMCGDLGTAERLVGMLRTISTQHNLRIYHDLVPCFEGVLLVKQGEVGQGLQLLRDHVNDPIFNQYTLWLTGFLCDLGEACVLAGEISMGLSVIDRGLGRTERLQENWCRAEFLHLKGSLTLQLGLTNAAATTEALLKQSLNVAIEQATLSWQLRTATTLARLWRDQGRRCDARDLLSSVYERFTEGFSTSDLRISMELIKELE